MQERWLQPGAEYYSPPADSPAAAAAESGCGTGASKGPSPPTALRGQAGGEGAPLHPRMPPGSGSRLGGDSAKELHGTEVAGGSSPVPPSSAADARQALRFLPFSSGPRDCIGQSLAKMNYMATLAVLLGRFSFRLAPEVRAPQVYALSAYPLVSQRVLGRRHWRPGGTRGPSSGRLAWRVVACR